MKNIVENQGIKNDKPLALTYEQLKQRLDAVVAECATQREALNAKAYIEWIKANGWDAGAVTINGKFQHFMDSEVDFGSMAFGHARKLIMNVETPSVNAALAEIKACVVEKFAAQQEVKMNAAALIGATHLESAHEFAALQARAFAVELREGRV
jgi:hypothetical protein